VHSLRRRLIPDWCLSGRLFLPGAGKNSRCGDTKMSMTSLSVRATAVVGKTVIRFAVT
jgi:hypothetical protein